MWQFCWKMVDSQFHMFIGQTSFFCCCRCCCCWFGMFHPKQKLCSRSSKSVFAYFYDFSILVRLKKIVIGPSLTHTHTHTHTQTLICFIFICATPFTPDSGLTFRNHFEIIEKKKEKANAKQSTMLRTISIHLAIATATLHTRHETDSSVMQADDPMVFRFSNNTTIQKIIKTTKTPAAL